MGKIRLGVIYAIFEMSSSHPSKNYVYTFGYVSLEFRPAIQTGYEILTVLSMQLVDCMKSPRE